MILMHAAGHGEGVARCGGRLAEDFIERGELIRPVAQTLASEGCSTCSTPSNRPLRPHADRFRHWLL